MKTSLTSFFIVAFCMQITGQNSDSLIHKTPVAKDLEEVVAVGVTPEPSNAIDIKATHWNTVKYNPFKDERVSFPVKLNFSDSHFRSPVLHNMVVTSRFGWRRGRAHQGIDIDLITGDDVVAVLEGVVRLARWNGGHGRAVVVRHFNGLETTYAHLSSFAVKANDTVRKGQVLGKGGATGNARGSHLHLVVSYKGIAINPEYLFDFGGTNAIRAKELWVTRRWTQAYYHSSRRMTKLELLTTEEEALASLVKTKTIYVVRRGDTLSHIARSNNTSIRSICVSNNISRNAVLKVGQTLILEL